MQLILKLIQSEIDKRNRLSYNVTVMYRDKNSDTDRFDWKGADDEVNTYESTDSMIESFRHKGLEDYFFDDNRKGIQAKHAKRLKLILY